MAQVLVITPVKNAIETTLDTARAIAASSVKVQHVIFNDFSTEETKASLEKHRAELGHGLIHIEDLTNHPPPLSLIHIVSCRQIETVRMRGSTS